MLTHLGSSAGESHVLGVQRTIPEALSYLQDHEHWQRNPGISTISEKSLLQLMLRVDHISSRHIISVIRSDCKCRSSMVFSVVVSAEPDYGNSPQLFQGRCPGQLTNNVKKTKVEKLSKNSLER